MDRLSTFLNVRIVLPLQDGRTSLRAAARDGHLEVVSLLLDKGAEVKMVDKASLKRAGLWAGVYRMTRKGHNVYGDMGFSCTPGVGGCGVLCRRGETEDNRN